MTLESRIERVSEGGNLLANLRLIKPKTWQTSQEVFKDWNNGAPVIGVNTANLAVYRLVNNEVVFNLLGREGNPFCDERFQKEAYEDIRRNNFFFPSEAMKEHIVGAIQPDATVRYSGLHIIMTKGCGLKDYGYVNFDGKNNDEEKKLFALVYGTENPGNGKRVYLLRKDVVKNQLEEKKEDNMIARACYFDLSQYFFALVGDILNVNCAVRGVRREIVAEDSTQKIDDLISVQLPRSTYAAMKAGQPFTFEGKKYETK